MLLRFYEERFVFELLSRLWWDETLKALYALYLALRLRAGEVLGRMHPASYLSGVLFQLLRAEVFRPLRGRRGDPLRGARLNGRVLLPFLPHRLRLEDSDGGFLLVRLRAPGDRLRFRGARLRGPALRGRFVSTRLRADDWLH